jgi:hypothetical protein
MSAERLFSLVLSVFPSGFEGFGCSPTRVPDASCVLSDLPVMLHAGATTSAQ